jgi:hypothetical protein
MLWPDKVPAFPAEDFFCINNMTKKQSAVRQPQPEQAEWKRVPNSPDWYLTVPLPARLLKRMLAASKRMKLSPDELFQEAVERMISKELPKGGAR